MTVNRYLVLKVVDQGEDVVVGAARFDGMLQRLLDAPPLKREDIKII